MDPNLDRTQQLLDDLRHTVVLAEERLLKAVAERCPGKHKPTQHRDRQEPWCEVCGRSACGVLIRAREKN
jgi:hypothetical protein